MASRGRDGLFFTWWISRTSAISELDGMAARARGKRRNGRMLEKVRDRRAKKEKGRRGSAERGAGRVVEEAFYAFLSSRGFVCNNLCGKTA